MDLELSMTEAEWRSGNAQLMLGYLQDAGLCSRRKLLLLACACCRGLHIAMSPKSTSVTSLSHAIELVEAAADGHTDTAAIEQALHELEERLEQTHQNVRAAAMIAVLHTLEAAQADDLADVYQAVSNAMRNAKRAGELRKWADTPYS